MEETELPIMAIVLDKAGTIQGIAVGGFMFSKNPGGTFDITMEIGGVYKSDIPNARKALYPNKEQQLILLLLPQSGKLRWINGEDCQLKMGTHSMAMTPIGM